jgi:2,3-dihydroxy-2,3-dihydrophenylpropionate dehydrogenase
VAPGGVLGTDLRGSPALGLATMRMRGDDDRVADLKTLTPLHLAMTPEDIAESYVFLASDAALGMTGEFLHPDGGLGVRG